MGRLKRRVLKFGGTSVGSVGPLRGALDLPATRGQARHAHRALPPAAVAVVTGFIGGTGAGVTTLLGRGGSDLTAALLGRALSAERVEIWTDVDGVMSADPRVSPAARTLPRLTYSEATALARRGAKVLHPRKLEPLAPAGIPVWVGNTSRPGGPGTWIGPDALLDEIGDPAAAGSAA